MADGGALGDSSILGSMLQYCDQDVDRDGQVGYTELIDLMSNWGLATSKIDALR